MIETLLVFPAPPPPELSQCLDQNGWVWKAVNNSDSALEDQPDGGWGGGIIVADSAPSISESESLSPILILKGHLHFANN